MNPIFLSSTPAKESVAELLKHASATEKLIVSGQEVYQYCPDGYGKSKLFNTFIERKLGVEATTRNWKTVHRLLGLSV